MQHHQSLDLAFYAEGKILLFLPPLFEDESFEGALQKIVNQHFLTFLGPHVNFDAVGKVILQKGYFRLQVYQLILSAFLIQAVQSL